MQINDFKEDFDKVLEFLRQDIVGLRTGRASIAMVEDISISAYGTYQALKALASISVADAKTLNIEPWDKTVLGAIEKGIRDSGIGVSPVNDGRLIRVILPDLTTERRRELTKVLHEKLENARVALRKVRQEVRDLVEAEEESKTIGEDEKFKLFEDLEKLVKEFNDKIKEIGEKKEAEINTI
ncbi:MAG: ribosome recycling factor [Candidatus Magasanikbacteria bacterium]